LPIGETGRNSVSNEVAIDRAQPTKPPREPLRVVVADPNLIAHRELFESNVPEGTTVS
jgi:hypothetical protein